MTFCIVGLPVEYSGTHVYIVESPVQISTNTPLVSPFPLVVPFRCDPGPATSFLPSSASYLLQETLAWRLESDTPENLAFPTFKDLTGPTGTYAQQVIVKDH